MTEREEEDRPWKSVGKERRGLWREGGHRQPPESWRRSRRAARYRRAGRFGGSGNDEPQLRVRKGFQNVLTSWPSVGFDRVVVGRRSWVYHRSTSSDCYNLRCRTALIYVSPIHLADTHTTVSENLPSFHGASMRSQRERFFRSLRHVFSGMWCFRDAGAIVAAGCLFERLRMGIFLKIRKRRKYP